MSEEMPKMKIASRVQTTLKPKNVLYCRPNVRNCRRQIWVGKGEGRGKQYHTLPSNYSPQYRKLTLQLPLACWNCGFESPWRHGGLPLVRVECRQVQVSASDSLVQRSPTEWGVSDGQEWTKSRPWPTRGCWAMNIYIYIYIYIYTHTNLFIFTWNVRDQSHPTCITWNKNSNNIKSPVNSMKDTETQTRQTSSPYKKKAVDPISIRYIFSAATCFDLSGSPSPEDDDPHTLPQ
jgi:hypothetical protein